MIGGFSNVGPLLALAALPMLISLRMANPHHIRLMRRIALAIAILVPLIIVVFVFVMLANRPTLAVVDMVMNYDGAYHLYVLNQSPYDVFGAISFPFPTFFIYWLMSAFGQLTLLPTWIILSLLNAILWGLCTILILPTLAPPHTSTERGLRIYIVAAIPAMLTIWQGQTAIIILMGLTLLHLATQPTRQLPTQIIGGIGLGVVSLVKPQIGLVGVGVALCGLLAYRDHRSNDVRRIIVILVSTGVTALALILLSVIIPNGVTFDLYVKFFREVLPQIAKTDTTMFNPDNGTLAYMASLLSMALGASGQTSDLVANLMTGTIILLAIVWTYQRRHLPLYEISAGWAAWAILAPRIAFGWYAVWCLPFFLLSLQESKSKSRLALIIITLALLNLQSFILVISFLTMLLFGVLVWTSFTEQPASA